MTPAEVERIKSAAVQRGRSERREQGIPERIEASTTVAVLASLLLARPKEETR